VYPNLNPPRIFLAPLYFYITRCRLHCELETQRSAVRAQARLAGNGAIMQKSLADLAAAARMAGGGFICKSASPEDTLVILNSFLPIGE
jgi:hypothetical protein